jgi:hypothetical protein
MSCIGQTALDEAIQLGKAREQRLLDAQALRQPIDEPSTSQADDGLDFETLTEKHELLDTLLHYERYATGPEESVWVCVDCGDVDVDPYEQDCSCYALVCEDDL